MNKKVAKKSLPGWPISKSVVTALGLPLQVGTHLGEKLVADARNQQPFELGEWGLRVVFSGHFYASLHVGHARRKQAGIILKEYLLEAKIKTNKQTSELIM